MQRDTLLTVLTDLSGTDEPDAVFSFHKKDDVSVMLAAEGTLVTVTKVARVELRPGYVVVEADRSETYLVEETRILGFKVRRTSGEGTGFVKG